MRRFPLSIPTIAVAIQLTIPLPDAWAAVETNNLLRNGDFEEAGTPPPGWQIEASQGESYALSSNALTGKNALKMSLPMAGGTVTASSEPCAVIPGEEYLFTCWCRGDGAKEGGTLCSYIEWQDATGRTLASVMTSAYNPPVPDYRAITRVLTAPADAAKALVRYRCNVGQARKAPTAAFFIDQVRLMKVSAISIPAHPQKWEYVNRTPSSGLRVVADKDAAQGQSLVAESGTTAKNTVLGFGPYTQDQPVGEYLAVFRIRVKDNTKKEPVASLDVCGYGSFNAVTATRTLCAADFKQPGVYQDMAVRFVRPEEGAMEFRIFYQGATDLTYDKVTIVRLADLSTDQAQAAIWLGDKSAAVAPPAVALSGPAAVKRDTALVLAGLGHPTCFPTNALPHALKLKYSYLARIQTGAVLDIPFPKKLDELKGVGLIVLADVPASALNGLMGRTTLRQFVEQGGGLLVFGGPLSLGKGEYGESVLAPVLPVALTGPWDLVKVKAPRIKVATTSLITDGLRWNEKPVLLYCQKTTAKPDAETLLECSGLPVLVTGRYGRGRVAVLAGTYLGEPAGNSVLFYQWSDYPELLARVVQWLSEQT
ncbi:MAG: glutamine amidotransferase [Kiritimatiellae bacterium]|nr:glutamine amidotransferase [Kiritimatiellia bacterium]